MKNIFDLGIIGGGPAGYSAAIRASQKGLKTVLFEKDCMGGVCLNRGCIPTKTILHCTDFFKSLKKAEKFGISFGKNEDGENVAPSADYEKIFNRKNDIVSKIQKSLTKLVQSHGVQIICAEAKLSSKNCITADGTNYECKNIVLATGSKPSDIKGLECDGEFVLNSNHLLCLDSLPDSILILGSGAIGVEWARIFSGLKKSVTMVELADRLLPIADTDVSKRLDRLFKKDKIKFFTGTKVVKIENRTVTLSDNQILNPDMILCAAGREPVMPNIDGIKIETEGKFVKVNDNFQTNFENIYAIGDLNGKMLLAHSAVHQAICVVDFIADKKPSDFDKNKVPSVIYGNPEIAWVGKTEEMLEGQDYETSCFPTAALGKAQTDDEIDGFVKVLSKDNRIIAAHIVSPEASSMIHQYALMIDNEMSPDDVLKTVFAHPTYSEAVFESILGLKGESLSLPPIGT